MDKQPQPQQQQNSKIGTPLDIHPKIAAQNLRNFVANVSGQGITGDTFWILMESIRNLEEFCKPVKKKPPKPAAT